jgi:hypothetical protein
MRDFINLLSKVVSCPAGPTSTLESTRLVLFLLHQAAVSRTCRSLRQEHQSPRSTKCTLHAAHHTRFCEECKSLWEVWTWAISKGPCKSGKCNGRQAHHATEDCGLGEWRDHPDNQIPAELSEFARPWPDTNTRLPLPIYYLKGIG